MCVLVVVCVLDVLLWCHELGCVTIQGVSYKVSWFLELCCCCCGPSFWQQAHTYLTAIPDVSNRGYPHPTVSRAFCFFLFMRPCMCSCYIEYSVPLGCPRSCITVSARQNFETQPSSTTLLVLFWCAQVDWFLGSHAQIGWTISHYWESPREKREEKRVRARERETESAQSGPKLRFLDYASIHTVDNSSFAYFICHLSGIVGEGPGNSGFVNTVHPSCTSPSLQFPFH